MGGARHSKISAEEESKNDRAVSTTSKVNERDLIEYYENSLESLRQSNKYGRALVVDDSKFNRKVLGKTIENFFTHIDQAENGLEALNLTTTAIENGDEYTVIFMDSLMPVMGGIEATAKIRALGFTNMIIGVTGDITAEDNERFLACGVNDVMLKPLLLSHVESILLGECLLSIVITISISHNIFFLDLKEFEKSKNKKKVPTPIPVEK